MMPKSQVFDDLLRFASTSRSKSTVTLAAVSFAICHLVVMGTSSTAGGAADLEGEIPRQLIHFAADLCRFALPLGVMVVGIIHGRSKKSRSSLPPACRALWGIALLQHSLSSIALSSWLLSSNSKMLRSSRIWVSDFVPVRGTTPI